MSEFKMNSKIELQATNEDKTLVLNKVTQKIYEIGLEETKVLQLIDGFNSPVDIASQVKGFTVEEIYLLEQQFEKIGLISKGTESNKKRNIFKIKLSVFSPNKLFKDRKYVDLLYYIFLCIKAPRKILCKSSFQSAWSGNRQVGGFSS